MRLPRLVYLGFVMLLSMCALPMATTAQGNSEAAHACQQGGSQNYIFEREILFNNTGQCVSHAARGGALPNLSISQDDQTITATGFDPKNELDLYREASPSGYTDWLGRAITNKDGTYTFNAINFCFDSANTGAKITATQVFAVTYTEFFALSCGD